MIEAVLARLRAAGYLDDDRYAAAKARSLAGRGRSQAAIRATLARKGVGRETATAAVAALREEGPDPEFAAAVALARRRRLGPWRAPRSARRPGSATSASSPGPASRPTWRARCWTRRARTSCSRTWRPRTEPTRRTRRQSRQENAPSRDTRGTGPAHLDGAGRAGPARREGPPASGTASQAAPQPKA